MPSFKEMSAVLGMNITAANLKELRPQIISKMSSIANGEAQPGEVRPEVKLTFAEPLKHVRKEQSEPIPVEDIRRRFKEAVSTNAAIDAIQQSGVEIIHSAGNDGPHRFDIDFLEGKTSINFHLS